jgi:1,4-dihydroxy-2-naphthoate polyprenyltransferase
MGTLWRMLRPGFLLVTVVGCLLGLAAAHATGCAIHWATALATVLLATLAHAATNVFNDYHDALNGADAANRDGLFPFTGGARLIQNGEVTAGATGTLAALLFLALAGGGLTLAWHSGTGVLAIGLAGAAIGWAYSAPPLKLMSRGLGELAVAMAWWLVVVGSQTVQCERPSALALAAGVGFALLLANILLINSIPDAVADAAVGKRTLTVCLGVQGASRLYARLVLAAHAGLLAMVAMAWLPTGALLGLLSVPLSGLAAVQVRRHAQQPAHLRNAIVLTIAAAQVHGLALVAGLVWSA